MVLQHFGGKKCETAFFFLFFFFGGGGGGGGGQPRIFIVHVIWIISVSEKQQNL